MRGRDRRKPERAGTANGAHPKCAPLPLPANEPAPALDAGTGISRDQAVRRIAGNQPVPASSFPASVTSSVFLSLARLSAVCLVAPSVTASSTCAFDTRLK